MQREAIYQENKLTLYHFQSQVKKRAAVPLLLVFSLINRPDILDFSPERSFIKALVEGGREVYLLDWGYPTPDDFHLSLSVYLENYLRNCVKKIKRKSRQKKVDLLGICQGGVLSLCYASLFPEEIRRLVLISTPIDFQTEDDVLSKLARRVRVDALLERRGNIPGAWLARLFLSLRPFHLLGKKYLTLFDRLSEAEQHSAWLKQFFRVEKWLLDTPDQAGSAFCEFVKIFYQQNSLVHGKFSLNTSCINLHSLRAPVLNVVARDDHLVPPRASRALRRLIPAAAYRLRTLPAGHIGIYLSQKTSKRLPKMIVSWLEEKEGAAGRRRRWKNNKKKN